MAKKRKNTPSKSGIAQLSTDREYEIRIRSDPERGRIYLETHYQSTPIDDDPISTCIMTNEQAAEFGRRIIQRVGINVNQARALVRKRR